MRCRRCAEKAAINMRQHRLALCTRHYPEWFAEQTQRCIEKYRMFRRGERVLVAVSGGKDSLTLWDVLHSLGYAAEGLHINLGIGTYSSESEEKTRLFAEARGLRLHVFRAADVLGGGVQETAGRTVRGTSKPCGVCGTFKRYIMNQVTRQEGYDVVATGHNLDDEAAVLLGNTLNWDTAQLSRQQPLLAERQGLQRKAKPLCRFYERETTAYALLRGIDYVYDECPYSEGSKLLYYKNVLNRMETDRPGLKMSFYLKFLQARGAGWLGERAEELTEDIHRCPRCGELTHSGGLCSFCRLLKPEAGDPAR